MSEVASIVLQRGQPRFDMVGRRLPDVLYDTDQTISTGLVKRLHRYALAILVDSGFEVESWACEVCTMDADERPAERAYTVTFTNPRNGKLGVQGILTRCGWPCVDHGLFVG